MTRSLPLVKKEVRAVAPLAAMCIAVVAVTFLLGAEWHNLGLLAYVVGSAGIGATVIGHEFSSATLGTLLVQPVARERIMAIKLLVAALALAVIGAAASSVGLLDGLPPILPPFAFQLLVLLTVLSVAPWLTMLTGSAIGGTVGALASPVVLAFALFWLGVFADDDITRFRVLAGAMLVVAPVAFAWGWWLFTRRLEDLVSSAGQIHLRLGGRLDATGLAGRQRRAFGRVRELVGKEIRLQQLPIVLAGFYTATSLLAWLTTDVVPADLDPRQAHLTWLFGGATALLIGAVASAEERQLGTMPWQVILPVSPWQQFLVKSALVVVLSVALTWGLPALVARTVDEPTGALSSSFWWMPRYALATIALPMVGLYVSSLTGSSLRAFLTSIPAIAGLAGVIELARVVSRPLGLLAYDLSYPASEDWLAGLGPFSRQDIESALLTALVAPAAVLAVVMWRFALANHSRADGVGRHARRQAISLALLVLIASLSIFSVEAAVVGGPTARGVISGIVVDEHGEPVSNVVVRAAAYRHRSGRRELTMTGLRGLTDDRGRFSIGRLAPGDYYPVARTGTFSSARFGSPVASGFVRTFYPSTADVASAQAVTADGRTQVDGVTIAMIRKPMARLVGRLADESGQPVSQGEVFLSATEIDSGATRPMLAVDESEPDGQFSFHNVPPGAYTLEARGPDSNQRESSYGYGRRVVTIDGEDVTGLELALVKGATLRGSIVFDGEAAALTGAEVRVWTEGTVPMFRSRGYSRVHDDGTFEVTNLFGRHLVQPRIDSSDWILKEVRLEGRDVTDIPLDFRSGNDIDGLEVVVTDQVAHITGAVYDDAGRPASRCRVIVFSPDPDKWTLPSRHLPHSVSVRDGAFRAPPLPPGEYLVVALSYGRDWEDPASLEALRPLATPVTLGVGETIDLSLEIVR